MIYLIFLSVFLLLMIVIGIWGMKKTTNLQDFFLGGRSIGPWMSAFAYGTTYFSAVLFIGFAGKQGWGFGWNALWIAAGNCLIGGLGAWLVLGRRTRLMSKNLDAITMPEFLHERYSAPVLKSVSAVLIFVFLLPYSASAFKGLGQLFEAVFHIPYDTALAIMVGITGVYLIMGGYFAVTLTDFVQGIIMLVGYVLMVIILTGKAGGLSEVITDTTANYAAHIPEAKRPSFITIAGLVFMTSFGVWGLPQMIQKFYAVKSVKVIKSAAIVTFIFSLVIGFSAYYTGALTHVCFDPSTLPKLADGTVNFDSIIPTLHTGVLPEFLMAVILLLVLSASMSTLASLVLVSSSSIAIDIYKPLALARIAKTGKGRDRSLPLIRILSGVFVVISFLIARYPFGFIVTLMSLSWGCLAGVWAGMVTGVATMIILFFWKGPSQSPLWASWAILLPFAVVPLVSAFTRAPSKGVLDRAFTESE